MPHDPNQPLMLSDPTLADASRRDTWLERLPVIGGFFHYHNFAQRLARAAMEVDELLKRRPAFPADVWQATAIDPAAAEPVAQAVAHLFVRKHPNHYYRPDDSLWLLMLDSDNMALLEASFVCAKKFGRKIDARALPPLNSAHFIHFVRVTIDPNPAPRKPQSKLQSPAGSANEASAVQSRDSYLVSSLHPHTNYADAELPETKRPRILESPRQ